MLTKFSASDLSGESAEEGEPEVAKREREILVEKVAQKLGHSQVGPSAVDEQQAFQIAELGNAVIGCQHGLTDNEKRKMAKFNNRRVFCNFSAVF